MDIMKFIQTEPQLVDSKRADDSPGPYCMSFGFDLTPLTQSISKIGLINSPLLIKKQSGFFTVIAGYRRIKAMKSLEWKKIPCRILTESKISPLQCFFLNLYDNLATRKFNEVEKGMILSRLCLWLEKNEILEVYMPLLDLPSHEPTLLFYKQLEEELDTGTKEHLVQKNLSLQVAKMLLEMEPAARSNVFRFISNIKFNINQQKQLIDYIVDLSNMENKSTPEILKEPWLEEIVTDNQLNNPQKVKVILKSLRARRFPTLVKAEKLFKKQVSRLDLPEGATISVPPFFEDAHYRLELLFKQGKELREKVNRLSQTVGLEQLGNPWEKDA